MFYDRVCAHCVSDLGIKFHCEHPSSPSTPINGIETAYKDRYTFAPPSKRSAQPVQWYILPSAIYTTSRRSNSASMNCINSCLETRPFSVTQGEKETRQLLRLMAAPATSNITTNPVVFAIWEHDLLLWRNDSSRTGVRFIAKNPGTSSHSARCSAPCWQSTYGPYSPAARAYHARHWRA